MSGVSGQTQHRPSLIDYNPVAKSAAIVISSDKMARFTILTPKLIRMEYAREANQFEDHSTIAMLNRDLELSDFTSDETNSVLTIKTAEVTLSYTVGKGSFSSTSLTVASNNQSKSDAFTWHYGDPSPGNLLGKNNLTQTLIDSPTIFLYFHMYIFLSMVLMFGQELSVA